MLNKLPKKIIDSAKKCELNAILRQGANASHLYIESNKTISLKKISGMEISYQDLKDAVKIKLVVKKGVKIKKPVFLCFGVLAQIGEQKILSEIKLEEGAEVKIISHCAFPQAKDVTHKMDAQVKLEKNSKLVYEERHYHGEDYGADVVPHFSALVGQGAYLKNELILNKGSIGKLKIVFEAKLEKDSLCEVVSKVIGKGKGDSVEAFDKILLSGEGSRGLTKFRGAIANHGKMFFKGITEASAKGARGHIDCKEIIIGKALAESVPIIKVNHPEARITHEASIGKVNQKELETLMTRGLSEKEAIDFIVKGKIK
ncbi:MAG: SufD family Fe-S cluster assembly protein [Patescibacteria group bacterium]|nr:SufD family Fe-S cluster assembly protein [Patescibacteria group bacterium]